jgi:hypothetical protein
MPNRLMHLGPLGLEEVPKPEDFDGLPSMHRHVRRYIKFDPVNKRRTREKVEPMRLAEQNRDDVWKAMDHESCRYPVFTPRVRELQATRRKERTPPWDETQDESSQTRALSVTRNL